MFPMSFLLTLSFLLVMLQALEIAVSLMDCAKTEAHLIILSLITLLIFSEKYKTLNCEHYSQKKARSRSIQTQYLILL